VILEHIFDVSLNYYSETAKNRQFRHDTDGYAAAMMLFPTNDVFAAEIRTARVLKFWAAFGL
jgi:hypothetical protein